MSFQGALRVMQCQICVTDLGECWWRELCVGRQRLRADSNSQYKNSSRQEGRSPAWPADADSQRFTHSNFTELFKPKHICTNMETFIYFGINLVYDLHWENNMNNGWLVYPISLMASCTWGIVSETMPDQHIWRGLLPRSWDSALFLMSCLPLLAGCSKKKSGWNNESLCCWGKIFKTAS